MGRTKKQILDLEIAREKFYTRGEPNEQSLQDIIDSKDIKIMELNHQIVGYKAVISYLEHQLGLNKSQ